jgi:bis(5'-nucleosidyl)-tetraphosphatase
MPPEKSCGIVVFREELPERLYLLLHYEEGHWDFPKGHIERDETEKEAAFREVYEETGIPEPDFELVMGFRECIDYSFMRGDETVEKEVCFFLGRTGTSAIRLSKEHIGFAWLPYESARSRLTYGNARGVLEKAESALKEWGFGTKD